jgi:hypothetical protein
MGHYAKVINGVVIEVIVADKDFIDILPDANGHGMKPPTIFMAEYITTVKQDNQ